jgi:tetratricopeptide (TPR) repeat protein
MWMIFDTREQLEAVAVPENLRDIVARLDVDRAAGAAILRVTMAKPGALTFAEREGGRGWTATIGGNEGTPLEPVLLRRGVAANGRTVLQAKLPKLGQIFWMDDADTGDRLAVVTAMGPAYGMPKGQSFVELRAHPTVHGLALSPRSDDVTIEGGLDEVTVARDGGMTVSLGLPEGRRDSGESRRSLLLDVETWRTAGKGDVRDRANALSRAAAEAPKKDVSEARLRLAAFQLAAGGVTEATGILKVIEQDDAVTASAKPVMLLRAIAAVKSGDGREAARLLSDNSIALEPEAALWRAALDANNGDWTPALVGFRQSLEALDRYPDELQAKLRPLVVRAAIESGDPNFAAQQLDQVERLMAREGDTGPVELMRGRIAAQQNRGSDAMNHYRAAAKSRLRETEAEARLELALGHLADPKADHASAVAELETVTMIWRKSEIEVRALAKLGEIYAAEGRWRLAFSTARRSSEVLPGHPLSRKLHDRMAQSFEDLFLEGKADALAKVEAVGLFYDFRNLMPISRRGDEIVRRLADRLAELDLLDQATELLQHQVDNRLGGLQRARVASRLAVLYLMNRKPAEAVQAIKKTRSNELPEDVRRGRLLLEARGLSELSRTDLALEILAGQKGDDVERLRADVLWRGKRWAEAGEALERVLGDSWQGAEELSEARRADVMRSGVSFVLADDRIALDRLRQKFAPKMARSADARAFALVTSDHRNRPAEFRDIARTTVAEDTLTEFLNVYRKRYPDAAGAPRNPNAAADAVRERQQQGAAPSTGPAQPG